MKKIVKIISIAIVVSCFLLITLSNASSEFEYSGVQQMEFSGLDNNSKKIEISEGALMIINFINIMLTGVVFIFCLVGVNLIKKNKKKTGIFFIIIAITLSLAKLVIN